MWMEVTVPYVEALLDNDPARGFRVGWLISNNYPVRFYYGQTFWVDAMRSGEAGIEYHVRELYGSRDDRFWVPAEAFKPVFPEELTPISPEVENKEIVINIARQTLSCYEDGREVFFTRVSTGGNPDWAEDANGVVDPEGRLTPIGYGQVHAKYGSIHMEGGRLTGGYDLGGIGWTTFIFSGGIAIHSTYWHNNFGYRTSAGCVNVRPEDAKWIFRWTSPEVPYYPGKLEGVAGTRVRTVES
jgi:lipoprotein-anchoring transpeptidase ErfK/SrfK